MKKLILIFGEMSRILNPQLNCLDYTVLFDRFCVKTMVITIFRAIKFLIINMFYLSLLLFFQILFTLNVVSEMIYLQSSAIGWALIVLISIAVFLNFYNYHHLRVIKNHDPLNSNLKK